MAWKDAPAGKKRKLSKNDPKGLLEAIASDNMFWRLHAQRLLVERGQKDVLPQLTALVRNTSVDAIGTNGGALHALWALNGLGELASPTGDAYRAAVEALKHPAAGVRKSAVMVLPKTPESAAAILSAGLLQDRELHTRLAAVLAIADMPPSAEIGRALYTESQKPENFTDRWLSRAFYVAATRHKDAFLAQYKADRNALPFSGLSTALRIGDTKPDWRSPAAADLTTEWKEMQVPGAWETRGLPDFDGVVWFTKAVDVAAPGAGSLTLGRISSNAEVWVNGLQVTLPPPPTGGGAGAAPPAGRGNVLPAYTVPAGTLRAGQNVLTVRIQNNRNDGGFLGTPDQMVLSVGEARVPVAGAWKYRVERQTNAGAMYSKPGELAAHVAFTAAGGAAGEAGAALPRIAPQAPDVTLRLAVVPGQLKYDTTELTVAPNQLVEIVFTNPDTMQHNFVLGASGTADAIGAAAEQLAKSPAGVAQQYVPDIPQVIFSTKLLDPGQTMSFQFRAPAQSGQYPYICTFPGHWVTMRGLLNVVQPQGRGRGGR